MASNKPDRKSNARKHRLAEAIEALTALQFGPKQRNDTAAYTLLALLDLSPAKEWSEAESPLRGITPIIDFIAEAYGNRYAPNTRETIRDEAVKFFVEAGLLLRNPDKPDRPTNSGNTVYQVEPSALALLRTFGTLEWPGALKAYLVNVEAVKREIARHREMARVPVTLPDGKKVALSPGGQNPLIKAIIEDFCPHFAPGGVVAYIGDTENKFAHLEADYLAGLGVSLDSAAKMPDVIIHCVKRNWLLLIEAVTSAGPVDGKRRKELKELFAGSKAGLVFVTAFDTRRVMQSFLASIAWESEVWIAEDPAHMIHFNGDKFLGPYPDAMPDTLN
ncbi:MAG: hypothetical protein JNM99_20990 [Verrucomicrobiaceae bacterium]|nr:hypothetical protein [Verrucomicrobiaceae bacterium]